jgi:uncharacterized membrane protein
MPSIVGDSRNTLFAYTYCIIFYLDLQVQHDHLTNTGVVDIATVDLVVKVLIIFSLHLTTGTIPH